MLMQVLIVFVHIGNQTAGHLKSTFDAVAAAHNLR